MASSRPSRGRGTPLRAIGGALLILLVAAVPVGMHLGNQHAMRSLGRSLGQALGLEVQVSSLWSSFRPSVVIQGIRVGEARHPLLTVDRAEILLELRLTTRPIIREIRLTRPRLRLSPADLRAWAGPTRDRTRHPTGDRHRPTPSPHLVVDDGSLELTARHHGHELRLAASGVTLLPRDRGRRLVLGPTTLSLDGEVVADLAATALDLPAGSSIAVDRLATLGLRLHLPHLEGPALIVHSLTLVARPDGYHLRLKGRPPGREAGAIDGAGHLDAALSPRGPNALRLRLHRADLSHLTPLLASLGLRVDRHRLSGTLAVHESGGAYRVHLDLLGDRLRLHHPRLARGSLGPLTGRVTGELEVIPDQHTVRARDMHLRLGRLDLALAGSISFQGARLMAALDLRLPSTSCQDVLLSLPPGLTPTLEGMGLTGALGLRGTLRLDTADLDQTVAEVDLAPLSCRVLIDPPAADVRRLRQEVSIDVRDPGGAPVQLALGPSNPNFRELRQISRHLRAAFTVAEDAFFFSHQGFDPPQLRRALISNLKRAGPLRGASTISQQLIKNVFLDPSRTVARKLEEAILTWRLEQVIPKKRILELYLNLVEMGPGIHGVEQAARHYFGRTAATVSPLQAAHLAALTPSPLTYSRALSRRGPGPAWVERIQLLLRLMRRGGHISLEAERVGCAQRLTLLHH